MAPRNSLNFGQTLRLFRIAAKLSQEKLAEKSSLDRTYISMLERGIKNPTLQSIINICTALEIQIDLFMTRMINGPIKEMHRKEIKLPIMGTNVACGSPVGNDHFVEKEISLEKFILKHPSETFLVQATGESMSPAIQNGDYLVIDKALSAKNAHIILAQVDNEFTVKRFFKENNLISLKADNPSFGSIIIDETKKFIYCGTIITIIRNNP